MSASGAPALTREIAPRPIHGHRQSGRCEAGRLLASKVGMLPSHIALEIVRFYARLEEAQTWLPRLQEDAERHFSHSVSYVLDPAIEVVTGVLPALTAIEDLAGIKERTGTPNIKKAVDAQDFERTLHEG